ncbi:proton-conducting transporter membrane subunit [Ferruginibacter sp.]|uniref:proton-conducting transporter transmembrane domain-containing protein n=1 Tax=Ferruginibacter sp. TaxID=1940288 RepID=UPI0019CD737C|nr:proton-conducting transporter membrane subunit [Ferruginibacter sp.]MBC7627464.1 NADH/ubiquinone/plastoquinone (complex i) [Ferruginibacter sp.]
MSQNLITLIALISPLFFVVTAIASWFQPGFKPRQVITMSKVAAVLSLVIVVCLSINVYWYKLIQSPLAGFAAIGFSVRLDAVSVIMLGMISLLGFIIIKYSVNYLDGDQHQGAFMGRLAATIAAVQLLVISGNLGLLFLSWILTSISLHRLLVFYSDRPGAQLAAKKKFILARLADACLLVAIVLLYRQFGSGNLEVIFNGIKTSSFISPSLEFAALFLGLSAVLKSAQFPTHGWLIEVMETPTPVSALLHAGLLNAGPFLLIRMAFVMESSTAVSILLILIGGITALFASVAYLTQTSVKTALGYSSVGHMGFSLMICGLGVYPAAMLHLVAHSFYKAHAFLSSGSVIDVVRAAKVTRKEKLASPLKIILGIAMALALYAAFALIWGMDIKKDIAILLIGTVIMLGLSRIFTAAIAGKLNFSLLAQATALALIITVAFFALESATHYVIALQVPQVSIPQRGKLLAIGIILLAFALVIFIQLIASQLSQKPFYRTLAVHVRNGFYANAFFDRLVGALNINFKLKIPAINRAEFKSTSLKQIDIKTLKEKLV